MFHPCKVTVVKKGVCMELVDHYAKQPAAFSACDRVREDQEFIIANPFEMPEGICPFAWADIRPQILAIGAGGSFDFMRAEHTALATCTDPLRPVIFKIERIEP